MQWRIPGFVKREGRISKFPPGLKKLLSGGGGGGGGSDTCFFLKCCLRHLHYWVGVPSAYQTDLRGDKQARTKKSAEKRGAAADAPPSPLSPGSATVMCSLPRSKCDGYGGLLICVKNKQFIQTPFCCNQTAWQDAK